MFTARLLSGDLGDDLLLLAVLLGPETEHLKAQAVAQSSGLLPVPG